MDKAIEEKLLRAVEAQNKSSEKTLETLKSIDGTLKELNRNSKGSNSVGVKGFVDSAMIAKLMMSLDGIHELLKKK